MSYVTTTTVRTGSHARSVESERPREAFVSYTRFCVPHVHPTTPKVAELKTRFVWFDLSARLPMTYTAKLSGRSITLAWMPVVSIVSTTTVSGRRENGSDTLVHPVMKVHLRLRTFEETPVMAEFQTRMMLPSWANVADGYCADVARTVGDPNETEAMFPTRSRFRLTGTSTKAPAAVPPSAMILMENGDVSTAAGRLYATGGGAELAGVPHAPVCVGSLLANTTDRRPLEFT